MRAATALLLVLLGAGGCLKQRSTTTLKVDGSGTFRQTTTVDMERASAHAKQLKAQARGLGVQDDRIERPLAAIDAAKRKAALATREGIRVLAYRPLDDGKETTRTYELSVAFDSLRSLYAAGVVEDVSVQLERVREGKAWKLTTRRVFEGTDQDPLPEAAAAKLRRMRAALVQRYEKLWGDLEVTSTLALPARVLDHNGQVRRTETGDVVTWRIRFADLADPARRIQHVTFEHVEGLKLEPFELSASDVARAVEAAEREAAERAKKAAKAAKGGKQAPERDG